MNRSTLVRLVVIAAGVLAGGVTFAQQALEIIPLRHRTAEQVLPALQPLVEPGGTLSGTRNQLFLRASPANAAEIKRVLDTIDRPLRRLQISVRLDDAQERERRALGASGTISNRGAHVDVTAEDSRRSAAERVDQRLQVLEGGRATIMAGQSQVIALPGGGTIQDSGTGFEVVPRIAGNDVLLDIVQQREAPGARPGSVHGERISTMVRTRLGEWTEIGGTQADSTRDERGIGAASRTRGAQTRRVWLKVEALD
jgi:type II secretory pathway component GspD/PulD (secretin)